MHGYAGCGARVGRVLPRAAAAVCDARRCGVRRRRPARRERRGTAVTHARNTRTCTRVYAVNRTVSPVSAAETRPPPPPSPRGRKDDATAAATRNRGLLPQKSWLLPGNRRSHRRRHRSYTTATAVRSAPSDRPHAYCRPPSSVQSPCPPYTNNSSSSVAVSPRALKNPSAETSLCPSYVPNNRFLIRCDSVLSKCLRKRTEYNNNKKYGFVRRRSTTLYTIR